MRRAIQFGDILTDRHGRQCTAPAMTFSAPYWVFECGVATTNHGDDEAAALAHYDLLVHAHRLAMGNTAPTMLPVPHGNAAARADRSMTEGAHA